MAKSSADGKSVLLFLYLKYFILTDFLFRREAVAVMLIRVYWLFAFEGVEKI